MVHADPYADSGNIQYTHMDTVMNTDVHTYTRIHKYKCAYTETGTHIMQTHSDIYTHTYYRPFT